MAEAKGKEKAKEFWGNTKSFALKCKRVWYALKKPSKEEFKQVTKVSAIGVAIVGLVGFLIKIIMTVFNIQV